VWVPLAVDETRRAFEDQMMQGLPLVSNASLAPGPEAMRQIIGANPNAIGYLPSAWQPSGLHTILPGIQMPVLAASPGTPDGSTADLVACLQGEIGQGKLSEVYP
jgi:hypothetical protein